MGFPTIMANLSLIGYAIAAVCYLLAVRRPGWHPLTDGLSLTVLALATVLVTAAAMLRADINYVSETAGLFLAAVLGWLGVAAHLGLRAKRIGALLSPLITLILLVHSFVLPPESGPQNVAEGPFQLLLTAHIALAVVGQACAIAACGVALLYLWQQSLLKRKMLDRLEDSPAIDRLARALMAGIWCGFGFLTLGLITGAILVQMAPMPDLMVTAKVAWAGLVWIWYLAILLGSNLLGFATKRVAQMSLAGFCLLALTYFGIGAFRPWGAG